MTVTRRYKIRLAMMIAFVAFGILSGVPLGWIIFWTAFSSLIYWDQIKS